MSEANIADTEPNFPAVRLLSTNYLEEIMQEDAAVQPKKRKRLTKAQKREKRLKARRAREIKAITNQLKVELELSKRSQEQGHATWEEMCEEIKLIELKEELVCWEHKAIDLMEKKNDQIEMLLENIEISEQMQRRGNAKHVEAMEHLMKIHRALLESCRLVYESEASCALEQFYEELAAKEELSNQYKDQNERVMFASNLLVDHILRSDYEEFIETRNMAANSEIERRYIIRDKMCAVVKAMNDRLQNFVRQLVTASLDAHKYERISYLTEKQRVFVAESEQLAELESKASKLHARLQNKLLQMNIESTRIFNDLRMERSYFMRMFKKTGQSIDQHREATFLRLKEDMSECDEVLQHFIQLRKHGELLLSLMSMCYNQQIDSEKVVVWSELPMPKDNAEATTEEIERFKLQALDLQVYVDLTEEEVVHQMNLMRNFWRRQAMVEAQNLLLKEEKNELTKENERLVTLFKSLSKSEQVEELHEALQVSRLIKPKQICEHQTLKRMPSYGLIRKRK